MFVHKIKKCLVIWLHRNPPWSVTKIKWRICVWPIWYRSMMHSYRCFNLLSFIQYKLCWTSNSPIIFYFGHARMGQMTTLLFMQSCHTTCAVHFAAVSALSAMLNVDVVIHFHPCCAWGVVIALHLCSWCCGQFYSSVAEAEKVACHVFVKTLTACYHCTACLLLFFKQPPRLLVKSINHFLTSALVI